MIILVNQKDVIEVARLLPLAVPLGYLFCQYNWEVTERINWVTFQVTEEQKNTVSQYVNKEFQDENEYETFLENCEAIYFSWKPENEA